MKKYFLPAAIIIVVIFSTSLCTNKKQKEDEIIFSVVQDIGINEAKTEEEKPYQFSSIYSVDCDAEDKIG